MLDTDAICRAAAVESYPAAPWAETVGEMCVLLLSSGRCVFSDGTLQRTAGPGSVLLAVPPFTAAPLSPCHLLTAAFFGSAARGLASEVEGPVVQDAGRYPGLAERLLTLAQPPSAGSARRRSALGYEVLCLLEPKAQAAPVWPALVRSAADTMRENYGRLYGIEELSESLGVSKSHLVRVFHEATGLTPGQYLTRVRVEAAQQLLVRGQSLEIIATLCGFSGPNYLCKVFKKETGLRPSEFRARAGSAVPAEALSAEVEEQLLL